MRVGSFLRPVLVLAAVALATVACTKSPSTPPDNGGAERIYSNVLNYSATGWGGWSCPAGSIIVNAQALDASAGGDPSLMPEADPPMAQFILWKDGASTAEGVTYPDTPFGYTYGSGEEGAIAQNGGGVGRPIVLAIDCLAT